MAEEQSSTQDVQVMDPALARFLEFTAEAESAEKLSEDEWVEKTWDFLTNITDLVEKLPQEVQKNIIEIGRVLSKSGTSYLHDAARHHYPPKSPAKMAMMNELKKKFSSSAK